MMKLRIIAAIIAFLAAHHPASAAAQQGQSVALDPGEIEVVDGDTIRVARGYRLGPDDPIGHTRIRLLAIDTPELHNPRCANERVQGRAAADKLRELLQRAAVARIVLTGDRDKHRRPLARLLLGDSDVADILLRDGLALPWHPGRPAWVQRGLHWCPDWQPPPEN